MGEITDERASTPQGLLQSDDSNVSSTSYELAPSVAGLAITHSTDTARTTIKCRWSECGLWFGHLDLLASHVTRDHARSGRGGLFYCGWEGCSRGDRGFNARYKMLVHVRTHTNEKPHRCSQCAKSFSRAENLKIHARSHTGERPYVCTVAGCGKAYSNSSDRFKHTRTHSVDKPYVCKVPGCPKRYTDPSSLRKHVKTYRHYADDANMADDGYSPAEKEAVIPNVLKRDVNGASKLDFNNKTSFSDEICDKNVTKHTSDSQSELFVNGQGTQYDLFRSWLNADLAVLSRSLPLGLSLWEHPLLQKDPQYVSPKSLYEGQSVKHVRMDSTSSVSSGESNEEMSNDQESPLDLTIHRASTRT